MKLARSILAIAATTVIVCQTGWSTTYTFDTPIPGTIADGFGLGTGFTDRLPGTGSSLAANDQNLLMQTGSGLLSLQSSRSDINHSVSLDQLEAPGFLLSGVSGMDVSISALIRNVQVPNASDQLLLYFGTSATSVVRAGIHQLNVYLIVENQGNGDVRPYLSDYNAFAPGDDVLLTFGRTGGLWQLSWQDLTTPADSGSSSPVSFPWLDAQDNLYAGVMASNPGSNTPFTAQIDTLTVTVVPEPSTISMFSVCASGLLLLRRRHKKLRP
ncbi:MAG TPA: PEP-CTERM sorting domain-containing protein [Candidatus Acidoferrum sp.]|nr:PEP-CTERM sorting domain-containing protein [Candidatus Acidoferrum sp.]